MEQKPEDDIFLAQQKRSEGKMKVVIVIVIAITLFSIWIMMGDEL